MQASETFAEFFLSIPAHMYQLKLSRFEAELT